MDVAGRRIKATPTDYDDRTTPDGKTSSVHWVRFAFTPEEIARSKAAKAVCVLEIAHPNYGHMAVINPPPEPKSARISRKISGFTRRRGERGDSLARSASSSLSALSQKVGASRRTHSAFSAPLAYAL
jgi:hypothetical protein